MSCGSTGSCTENLDSSQIA
uniref:Uncharacterized protein n=1 Tax=Anguilla anguilla TaxID=7936 RepID=A0A0E9XRH4_ANGAN